MRLRCRAAGWSLVLLAAAITATYSGCNSEAQIGATATRPVASPVTKKPPATVASQEPATTGRAKLKPGAKTKVLAAVGNRSYDKTFDNLRFEMTVGEKFDRSLLTKDIEALNGQKIRIRGYILPTPQRHGIRQFVLVRDNQECCFGPGAALYDCILVDMKPGNTADFTIRPVAVEGTFNIKEFVVEGKHMAIYQMAAETAQ